MPGEDPMKREKLTGKDPEVRSLKIPSIRGVWASCDRERARTNFFFFVVTDNPTHPAHGSFFENSRGTISHLTIPSSKSK
jgi:hypothetical protein